MMTRTRVATLSLASFACAAALFASSAIAGERAVSISFAGSGYDTVVDTTGDIPPFVFPVQFTRAEMKGSFGAAQLAITTEWEIGSISCPAGFDLPLSLVNSGLVITSPDHSQIFGFSDSAWMCVNTSNGLYVGEMSGIYQNGTGRYQGASGEWTVEFSGATIDPAIGFRSITGSGTGKLIFP